MTEREHKLKLARIEAEHADKVLRLMFKRFAAVEEHRSGMSDFEVVDVELMLRQAERDKAVADANLELEESVNALRGCNS